MRQDCNNCANENCKGLPRLPKNECMSRVLPKSGFKFAELLLAHPQSTHDTLSNLPFKANLDFFLD